MNICTTFGSLLSDEEYADFHIQRKSASTMDRLQYEKFISIIQRVFPQDKAISVLSVGSGKGDFDKRLIEALSTRIHHYTCLEPIQDHMIPLHENLQSLLPETQLTICQGVVEEFYTDKKFDLIHNVHVIHWIKDPVKTLKKLESYLEIGGISVTVLQSERGMPRLYSLLKPEEAGSLTAEKLFKEMQEAKMFHYCMEYVSAVFDASAIVNREEKGKKILQFILSGKLTDEQFHRAIPVVQTLIYEKHLIEEPFAFIANLQ